MVPGISNDVPKIFHRMRRIGIKRYNAVSVHIRCNFQRQSFILADTPHYGTTTEGLRTSNNVATMGQHSSDLHPGCHLTLLTVEHRISPTRGDPHLCQETEHH